MYYKIEGPHLEIETQSSCQAKGITEILKERDQQVKKWGDQSHSNVMWNAILGEEFGEVSKEAVETAFNPALSVEDLKSELIQTAAVALAWLEDLYDKEDGHVTDR